MATLKVTTIDNNLVVFLPQELVEQCGVSEGSEIEFDEGVLRPSTAVVEDQLSAMKDVMTRRRDVLRRLAE